MTMSESIIAATTTSMWMILTTSTMIKSAGVLSLLLTSYSMMASISLSMKMKLTLIPFIITLTISGGLMIMFLYFTSSMENLKKNTNTKNMMTTQKIMITMTPLISMMSIKSNMMSTKNPPMDPASKLFTPNQTPLTLSMILLLGILLMTIVFICSKSPSPMRKKTEPWN